MMDRAAPGTIARDVVVAAGTGAAFEVARGETLRIVDLEGQQVGDLVAYRRGALEERLSMAYSNLFNRTWRLTTGHVLYTTYARPMWTITADSVGMHYTGGGFCCAELYAVRDDDPTHRNCCDNLLAALAPWGITRATLDPGACFNVFMNLTFDADGTFLIRTAPSRAGDFLDLRAGMDVVVAMSACPSDTSPCNGYRPTPMRMIVYS